MFMYLVRECIMMFVLCLNGWYSVGVVMVLLMINGILVLWVILVSVVRLIMLFVGLFIDL